MHDAVITVENLSKKYWVGHRQPERYVAFRDTLAMEVRNFLGKARDFALGRQIVQGDFVEEFWALKDLSFEVRRGEVLGVIGRNGAGKSTLLKILSRITEPTKGRVRIRGRVASLLEVGSGFHPELTGRENIYLNGAILGMTRAEIRRRFDEIVAFAEVEKFLDTPVKRYSSGMHVRLAFAVAAHLEADILIMDEVLAVGDAGFQQRCMGKMQDVTSSAGRSVLFVSHNMGAIRQLCSRAILLEGGTMRFTGDVDTAIERYLQDSKAKGTRRAIASENSRAAITHVEVDPVLAASGHFKLTVEFSSEAPLDPVLIGAVVHSRAGTPLFGFNTWQNPKKSFVRTTKGVATLVIRDLPLHSGQYGVSVFLGEKYQNYVTLEDADQFTFVSPEPLPLGLSTDTIGHMRVNGSWHIDGGE